MLILYNVTHSCAQTNSDGSADYACHEQQVASGHMLVLPIKVQLFTWMCAMLICHRHMQLAKLAAVNTEDGSVHICKPVVATMKQQDNPDYPHMTASLTWNSSSVPQIGISGLAASTDSR